MTDLIARLPDDIDALVSRVANEVRFCDEMRHPIMVESSNVMLRRSDVVALLNFVSSEPSRIRAAVEGEREACAGCADLEAFHAGAVWAVTSDDVRDRNAARVEIANQIASTIRART